MTGGPQARLKRLVRFLLVAFLLIVGGGAAYVDHQLEYLESEAVAQSTARLEGLTRALEEHVVRAISQVDDLMVSVIADLDSGIPLEDLAEADLYQMFNARIQRAPQIMSLGAFARDGRPLAHSALASTRSRPAPKGETFDYLRANPEVSIAMGRVVKSPITGHYVFPLTRRIPAPDGSIGGFLTAAFNPRYFSDFYQQLQLPPNGSVAIIHNIARRIVVRYPDTEAKFDGDLSGSDLFRGRIDQRQGSYVAHSVVDNVERLISFRRIKGIPLVVLVSLPMDDVLAQVWAPRRQLMAAAGTIALMLAAMGLFIHRHARLMVQTEVALRNANLDLERRVEERTRELSQEKANLRKLSRAVEQSPHMIFITDAQGVIEYVNPKFIEVTGFTPADAVGRQPRILKSGLTPVAVYEDLWRTIRAGGEWHAELQDRRKDGSLFWAAVSISPVRDLDGHITHFVSLHDDITDRKMAEEAVRQAKEQAEVASRAKSDLLASMSHELRTPLNAVIGYSEALLANIFGPLADKRQQEYLQDIRTSGLYLLDLINDLLDLSAVEAGKLKLNCGEVDLPAMIGECLRLIESKAASSEVALTGELASDLPVITADRRRLKQILLNLLSNAVKFTDSGGAVRLRVAPEGEDWVVFQVTDTGIGMGPDDIASAVTLFGRAVDPLARQREGTGLGLPLTFRLVKAHGGEMEIDSAKGRGTTVTVRLPRHCPV